MTSFLHYLLFLGFLCSTCCGGAIDELTLKRMTGELRKACSKRGAIPQPLNRVNTTARLIALRQVMVSPTKILTDEIDGFIVTSDDEHQTEYVSEYDRRREYISGFSGTSGDAIITLNKAALWVDARYHLQADEQLNCDWLLMREGQQNIPSKADWLKTQFSNKKARIGADPRLISAAMWRTLQFDLQDTQIELIEMIINPIDLIWENHEQNYTDKDVFPWEVKYAGRNWTSKVQELRKEIEEIGADSMVITALPEIAWLLNIRGRDIPYNPFVKSYVLLDQEYISLYVNLTKLERHDIFNHLNANLGTGAYKARLLPYEKIWTDLPTMCQKWKKVLVPTQYMFSKGVSRKIYNSVQPAEKRLSVPSPIIFMKSRKNPTEINGMEKAHVRDAVIMCKFFAYFQKRYDEGDVWSEMKVVKWLNSFRFEHKMSLGNSFETIAAFGPNAAFPHYIPTPQTNTLIFGNSTLVIDSGGQYYDGTTDVARTIHFGKPSKEQINAYTRVLKGIIQMAMLKFPSNMKVEEADVMARAPLWEDGYNYPLSTGNGIGSFLEVHESPIMLSYHSIISDQYFKPGYFFTVEPGFYLEEEFGVRLENVFEVVELPWSKDETGESFLGFKDVTLLPFEPKLINISLLSTHQRIWLNEYNARIRTIVGAELKKYKRYEDAFFWMMDKTKYIPIYGSSNKLLNTFNLPLAILIAFLVNKLI